MTVYIEQKSKNQNTKIQKKKKKKIILSYISTHKPNFILEYKYLHK